MPRRPGGPPSPVEDGLRKLVRDVGPSTQKLLHDHSEEIQAIMQAAQPPLDWSLDDKATAVMAVIYEAVSEIRNPRWRAAALAAFRLPFDQYKDPANDSVAGRWREVARQDGAHGKQIEESVEKYRGYWMIAAHHLARDIERRFHQLNNSPDGWNLRRPAGLPPPPSTLSKFYDQVDATYTFKGRCGDRSICYRWITVYENCDHHEATAWYYTQPDAPVEIIPIANCHLEGPLVDLPRGGRSGKLKFARTLRVGEKYFFSYETRFNSKLPCHPIILFQPRTLGIRPLTIRAQFDVSTIPTKCWHVDVDVQTDSMRIPEVGSAQLLGIDSNGYVEHIFKECVRGRLYGIQWVWPS